MESSCRLSHLLGGLCDGLYVWKVYCGKMADWIRMPFWMVSGVSRGMGLLDGVGDCRRVRSSFDGEFGVSHCNQWGLCSIVVSKCVNRSSCRRLGWWVGSQISQTRLRHRACALMLPVGQFGVSFLWTISVCLPYWLLSQSHRQCMSWEPHDSHLLYNQMRPLSMWCWQPHPSLFSSSFLIGCRT